MVCCVSVSVIDLMRKAESEEQGGEEVRGDEVVEQPKQNSPHWWHRHRSAKQSRYRCYTHILLAPTLVLINLNPKAVTSGASHTNAHHHHTAQHSTQHSTVK